MSTMRYQLNQGQLEFLRSKRREAAIVSGLGGGKSFALQLACLVTALRYPKALHCYGSLSYSNMRDSSIPSFINFLDQCRISYITIKSRHEFLLGPQQTRVIFRSQEVAEKMRSVEIGSLFADELAYWDEFNYKTFLGRLRDKNGPCIMRAATTPNGMNFFYELFVEHVKDSRELIQTSSLQNKHLPDSYIQMLEESYDSMLLKQERDGQFLNVNGGLTYYAFNRERNVKPIKFNGDKQISIGMDFNVNPMTAVCAFDDGNISRYFKEFYLENSNTDEMCKTIKSYFGTSKGITIIPDSTGQNRKTCSSVTDHQILRDHGFTVPPFWNPHRRDRFNNINGRLEHGYIEIDPSCKHLIKDFEFFVEQDESKTPMLGHISDAAGYREWHYHPINLKRSNISSGKIVL